MSWKALAAVCATVALVVTLPTLAQGAAKGTRISVSPASGGPSTTFSLRFTAPDRTGRIGGTERRDELTVSGPVGRRGCLSSASAVLAASRAGATVRRKLNPRRLGGHWCVGTFRGKIEETGQAICPKGMVCPQVIVLIRTVGAFKFTVGRNIS
jgi:hypothetical protein